MASVTITVVDIANGNVPVPAVALDIYDSAGTVYITSATTDNSGVATVTLSLATYTLRGFKAGYVFDDLSFTVDNATESVEYDASGVVVAPPASPSLCRLFADFVTMDGVPIEQFKIQVHNLFDPTSSSGLANVDRVRVFETDSSGHVEFDLVRGLRVKIVFVTTPLSRIIVVPDQPTANLLTMVGEVTDNFQVVS